MNLFHLRYFVTLAEMKHYTKAAEKLCISQPSLSHAIYLRNQEEILLLHGLAWNFMILPKELWLFMMRV